MRTRGLPRGDDPSAERGVRPGRRVLQSVRRAGASFTDFAVLHRVVPHAHGGGGPKFQPVYVGDVAAAIFDSVTKPGHVAKPMSWVVRAYTICGFLQIGETKKRCADAGFAGFRSSLPQIQAAFLQFLPKPLITPDQVILLRAGNVLTGDHPGLAEFGIAPTAVEGIVGTYLKRFRPLQQNKRMRLEPRRGA